MAVERVRKCLMAMRRALDMPCVVRGPVSSPVQCSPHVQRASPGFSGHPRGVFPSSGLLGFGEVVQRVSPGLSGHRGAFPSFGLAGDVRGYSTFDQAMQGRLASLANVKTPYPPMVEDSKKFRKRMADKKVVKPTQPLPSVVTLAKNTEKCEVRVHLCPPPWFYNIHGIWVIGMVQGVWIVHLVPKHIKLYKNIAAQQLKVVDQSTLLMMNEYWKSMHGVKSNPAFWIHENAKHSYFDSKTQMPDYFDQVIALGSQTIALLWKLGFEPNAFYERDHFLDELRKNQGVDVYLDFIEDPTTGIVYLDAYGFYFERHPPGEWAKLDHPTARVQGNGYFYLIY